MIITLVVAAAAVLALVIVLGFRDARHWNRLEERGRHRRA